MLYDHHNGKHFHVDGRLYKNLLGIRKIVTKKDFDWVFLCCGKEGYGKSTLAQQMGYVLSDGKFQQEDVCMTFDEFAKRCNYHNKNGNKGRAVIYDETMGVADSRSFNNLYNKKLRILLTQIRQANLFIFILLPSFFDLDKPISIHRSNTLIRVEVDRRNYNRGRWYLYNEQKKLRTFLEGKKTYQYKVKPTMYGSYSSFYCVDEKIYRKRKADATSDLSKEEEKPMTTQQKRWYKTTHKSIRYMVDVLKYTHEKVSKILETPRSTISDTYRGDFLEK